MPVDDADDDGTGAGAGAQSLDFFLGLYGGISEMRGGDGLTIAVVAFFLYGGISGICMGGVDIRTDEPVVNAAEDDATAAGIVDKGGPDGPLILPPPPPDDVVVDDPDVCAVL